MKKAKEYLHELKASHPLMLMGFNDDEIEKALEIAYLEGLQEGLDAAQADLYDKVPIEGRKYTEKIRKKILKIREDEES